MLKNFENVEINFHDYLNWIERDTKLDVGRIHTDSPKTFFSMRKGLETLGIPLTTSSPRTPQSKDLAVRRNKTLLDKAGAVMYYAKLREEFLVEVIRQAKDLHNRTATPG